MCIFIRFMPWFVDTGIEFHFLLFLTYMAATIYDHHRDVKLFGGGRSQTGLGRTTGAPQVSLKLTLSALPRTGLKPTLKRLSSARSYKWQLYHYPVSAAGIEFQKIDSLSDFKKLLNWHECYIRMIFFLMSHPIPIVVYYYLYL